MTKRLLICCFVSVSLLLVSATAFAGGHRGGSHNKHYYGDGHYYCNYNHYYGGGHSGHNTSGHH